MLSKPVAKGGKAAIDYHKKDLQRNQMDYYSHSLTRMDQFTGGLAEELGLTGQITPLGLDAFVNKCNLNQHRMPSKANPDNAPVDFFDMPFSCPKSISILATSPQYRDIVLDSLQAASDKLMQVIEKETGYRQRVSKSKVETRYDNKLLVGKCLHYLNRYNEPDLHIHFLIANITKRADGAYVAINRNDLFNNYMKWGIEGRRLLAAELQHRGIALTVTNPKKAFFEVDGLDDKRLLDKYSQRTRDIEKYCRNHGLELSDKNKEIAQRATRPQKEDVDTAKIYNRVNNEVFINGGTEPRTYKTRRNFTATKKEAIFEQAVHVVSSESFSFTKDKLNKYFLTSGVIDNCTQDDFDRFYKKYRRTFVSLGIRVKGNTKRHERHREETITTRENIKLFDTIEYNHRNLNRGQGWGFSDHEIEKAFNKQEQEDIQKGGFPASPDQRQTILSMLHAPDRYLAIEGLAGTGKTTSYEKAVRLGKTLGVTTIGLAPNGAAAEELHKSIGIEASTMASFFVKLRVQAAENRGERPSKRQVAQDVLAGDINDRTYDGLQPLKEKTLIIVDEAGLSDTHAYYEIEEIAKHLGPNCKIAYSGDYMQLKPIGLGDSFEQLVKSGHAEVAQLVQIYRQKSDLDKARTRGLTTGNQEPEPPSADATEAEKQKYQQKLIYYKKYKDVKTTLKTMVREGDVVETKDKFARRNMIIGQYLSDLPIDKNTNRPIYNDGGKSNVMLATIRREDCDFYNAYIHDKLKNGGHLGKEYKVTVDARNDYHEDLKDIHLAEGERIRFFQNGDVRDEKGKKVHVNNGTYGTVESITPDGKKLSVRTDEDKKLVVDLRDYNKIDRAYCITAFSSQGATAHKIIADLDTSRDRVSSNMNYVLASRVVDNAGLKIYVSDADRYIQNAEQAEVKDSPDPHKDALDKYRREQSLEELKQRQNGYIPPKGRAENARIQGIAVTEESAFLEVSNIPKEVPAYTPEQKPEVSKPAKKLHWITVTSDGYRKEIVLDRDVIRKIANEIYEGKRPKIETPAQFLEDIKKDDSFAELKEKNWQKFRDADRPAGKVRTIQRVRKLPGIPLSQADIASRNRRQRERFEKTFDYDLAGAGFRQLNKTLESYPKLIGSKPKQEPTPVTEAGIELTPPPQVLKDVQTIPGQKIFYYKSKFHAGDRITADDLLLIKDGELANAHLFANRAFMEQATRDPAMSQRIADYIRSQAKPGESFEDAYTRITYTKKLRQSQRGFRADLQQSARMIVNREVQNKKIIIN